MKFDGYGATIRDHQLGYVAERLAAAVGGVVTMGKPMRRYQSTLSIDAGPRMAAWLGQEPHTGMIYVEGKGETTPPLVQCIRHHFPEHSAPRIDVAEDYDDAGAFEVLQSLIRRYKGERVKGGYVALPDDVQDGKTWAAGTRGGVGYMRLYEAGKHPDRVHMGKPDWVRAELECRPHYARDKAAAAKMSPLEVWGMTSWTQKVGEALTQCPIVRFEPQIRRYSHDKTTRYIALTFRRHLEEMLSNGEHLEATIRDVWREEDEANRRH